MSLISPTTLFVTGSMSMTLSPAALVWTMRTVAAWSDRPPPTIRASSTEHLVFIAQHSKLRSHVGDLVFAAAGSGPSANGGAAALDARLRVLQEQSAAAPRRKTAGPCPLHHVPLDGH